MQESPETAPHDSLFQDAEHLRLLIDAVTEYAIYTLDAEGRVSTWNTGAERIKGYKAEEILGQPLARFFPEESRAAGRPQALLEQARKEGIARDEGWRVRKDGTRFFAEATLSPIHDKTGTLRGYAKVTRDVTDRLAHQELREYSEKLAESERRMRALAEEERSAKEQLRVILEGITDGILVQAPDGRPLYLNQACANLLGYPSPESVMDLAANPAAAEAVRREIRIFDEGGNPFPPESTPGRLALKGQRPAPVALRFRMTETGKDHWILSRAIPVHETDGRLKLVVSIMHDFTELREAELKLRQSQKMEAVGRLAGGIAHDFNNLLTAINGYSDLILQRLDGTGSEMVQDMLEIRKSGERAASLTQQLLAFSRKQILAPRILDLNEVLAGMDALLRRLIGEDVELRTILSAGLRKVKADQGQLEQVILNLALNARDAMPQGGKLTMETANVELDATYVGTHLESRLGPHVLLAITDTGFGMDIHVKARLFEPFFTTKVAGKGTGLGLSMVYGIVKQSGGSINVYSEPGRGTTFKIYLPVAGEAEERPDGDAGSASRRSAHGGETILLCEDEEGVRNLVERTLKDEGYGCLTARDGEAALALAQSHPGPIHLLLTDVVLPGMNGRALAEKLAVLRPGIAVVYMSGYTDNAIVHHGVLDPGMEFLNKPFSAQALKHRVQEALARPA